MALCVTLPFSTQAQSLRHLMPDSLDPVRKELYLAVGHANVLDTYLSPIEHAGTAVGFLHRAERLARWGRGKVSVQGFYSGNVSMLESVADRGRAYSGDITAYIKELNNIVLTHRTAGTSNRTFTCYDICIDVNYSLIDPGETPEVPEENTESKIKLGDNDITTLYLGDIEIISVYLGDLKLI